MKSVLLFLAAIAFASIGNAQNSIVIDVAQTYQTIEGFGASDAWNIDPVGKHWSNSVKETIAERLFSKEFFVNGNPKGIGLSRWRFNIGGGSAEQGAASNIEMAERRAECFLNEDGTYNWSKQAGQQWFLSKARDYGVETLVAFVNSPPRFYTKSGRANSNNTGGSTNLKTEHFSDYANFLVDVIEHFKRQEIHFKQVSPVNEPQYPWTEGQEGSPWMNQEIYQFTGLLNNAILERELDTKILLAEAESYGVLYQQVSKYSGRDDQINVFFNPASSLYLGNYSQVLNGIAGHGYWLDKSDTEIINTRKNIAQKAAQHGINFYQTEYCLLSNHYDNKPDNTIFLAKMVHSELAIANASVYDYWTAIERERWSQLNRFYLMRLRPTGGDYASLEAGGTVTVDKNLWAFGNYSLFVRPGYKRVHTFNSENLNGVMSSAFIAPDASEIVVVHVNWGDSPYAMNLAVYNMPEGKRIKEITPYVTDANNNLSVKNAINDNDNFTLTAKSVTTMVVKLEDSDENGGNPVANETILLSGENESEPVVYHDFVEWAKNENDKVPAWYINFGDNSFTTWVNNPEQTGINTSATSLLAETTTAVDWWGNFLMFRLDEPVQITNETRFLHMFHFREHNNFGWSLHLNTEVPHENSESGTLRFDGDNSNDGTWEDIVIDLNYLINNNIALDKILFLVDKAWFNPKNSLPSKYYFDELVLSDSPVPRTGVASSIGHISNPPKIAYSQNGSIVINCSELEQIQVFDMYGRLIYNSALSGFGVCNVPISRRGIYLVRGLTVNGVYLTEKVLVR